MITRNLEHENVFCSMQNFFNLIVWRYSSRQQVWSLVSCEATLLPDVKIVLRCIMTRLSDMKLDLYSSCCRPRCLGSHSCEVLDALRNDSAPRWHPLTLYVGDTATTQWILPLQKYSLLWYHPGSSFCT